MFTVDFVSISFAGKHLATYANRAAEISGEPPFSFSLAGYQGLNFKNVGFIGYDTVKNRTLLSLYGSASETLIVGFNETDVKVNRLDLQKTVETVNPDSVIEAVARDTVPYKRILVKPIGDTGNTLYVGSPHSEKRLRLYNKSAQTGDKSGNLLRIEMVFRASTANAVWTIWRQIGKEERDEYTKKEILKRAPSLLGLGLINLPSVNVVLPPREGSMREWIENIVKPAMVRLAVRDPLLIDEFYLFMVGLLGNKPNNPSSKE